MTADAATSVGMPMAKLADATDKKLKGILPSFATTTNPIDLTAALLSNGRLFGDILPVIAEDPAADAFPGRDSPSPVPAMTSRRSRATPRRSASRPASLW